ncbi:MAG: hypothetical protein AAF645_10670 [Myxococcota bacterium]
MSRAAEIKRVTPAKLRDYAAAAREAGLDPREVRVEPDGTLRLIFARETAPAEALDDWLARREAR